MRILRNNTTGEEIQVNGVDFLNNQMRLADGNLKSYPQLWTDCEEEVKICNNKSIEYLAITEEYKDFEIIEI